MRIYNVVICIYNYVIGIYNFVVCTYNLYLVCLFAFVFVCIVYAVGCLSLVGRCWLVAVGGWRSCNHAVSAEVVCSFARLHIQCVCVVAVVLHLVCVDVCRTDVLHGLQHL